ncbi:MAG: hypothetical protein A2340_04620 [Lentisphaerae bacterium RIFOXYB12_FULL_60_10]|nr:MAG: hypothetical protein A2340_04620 [Lentisphaerae bacterium RIFOXYB12_FULL_60_10]
MGTFRLDPVTPPAGTVMAASGDAGMTGVVLLHNARWFTRIRWIVVAALVLFGAVGMAIDPAFLKRYGLIAPGLWPWHLSGILALLNLGSIRWIRYMSARTPWRMIAANIWFQIVSDLVVLTGLVCRIGPTNTVVAFTYLFHISLACIFFGRRDSFLVTLLSAGLFLATVAAEYLELLPHPSVLVVDRLSHPDMPASLLFAIPAVFVWLIVWYLVSSLSEAVRRRDRDLAAANERILRADKAINQQMLRVTHDLKAPFSGIESNIQILKALHWGEMPESVREIVGKIDARSAALRARISDILTLGNLRSVPAGQPARDPVSLRALLENVWLEIEDVALRKQVSVKLAGAEVIVPGDSRQLKVLFANLLANAVTYSRTGGVVDIAIGKRDSRVTIRVADHGIGISDESLAHVFDDFYRTPEAVAFNPNSTGLGLAIVRQIAQNLRLTITAQSEAGNGTVFEVWMPAG